jgi:hypothetical protein
MTCLSMPCHAMPCHARCNRQRQGYNGQSVAADGRLGQGVRGCMMQRPSNPAPTPACTPVPVQSALQCCCHPRRASQEKQLFYAGTVPHVISEAKARCATAAPPARQRERWRGDSRGRPAGRSRRRWPLGLDKQKARGRVEMGWHLTHCKWQIQSRDGSIVRSAIS